MVTPEDAANRILLSEAAWASRKSFAASAFVAIPEDGVPLGVALQRMFGESIGCGEPRAKFTAPIAKLKTIRYH